MIKKETIQIVRDRRTVLIAVLMPLVLLLLFGFAISTEVNDIEIVFWADRDTPLSRRVAADLSHNGYFSFKGSATPSEMESLLKRGEITAGVVMREHSGKPEYQIIVDASNPTIGESAAAYIPGALESNENNLLIIRTLYNPQLKSSYNFVPGIMGMIFILICAILTSVSIVRERESGTMNLLLVSPVNPRIIIFGKLIPYFGLSCIILGIMLLMAYTVLGLPVSVTIWSVVGVTILYVVLSLAIGLFVSTIADTQVKAMIISAVVFMIPVILFSGMIFPIENLPKILRYFTSVIPARWYVSAMRKLMIQQLPLHYVALELSILGAMTVVIIGLALAKFNRK